MAWKDKLRPASFRGVPFYIEQSQYTGGRRVSFHEFPDRNDPFPEDLGKVGRTFKVEGHILGDNYFDTKEQLIEAAEKFGPGELIHPYYGTLQVQCGAFSIDEDTKDGRIAKISFQFYEAGNDNFPKTVDDKASQLLDKSTNALAKSKENFDNKFSVAGLPGFAVATARSGVESAADFFENATKGIATEAEGIANLAFGIRNLRAEVNDLLQAPSKLSKRLIDSFALLEAAIGVPKGRLAAFRTFSAFGRNDAALTGTTPTRERERDNKTAFDSLMREAALANSVNTSGEVEYESVNEATTTRNDLRDLIDEVQSETDSDDVFQAFKDLNAQLVRAVPDVDSDLPNVQDVTVHQTTNSLVMAYDLFENADTEEDIIARNKIRHPGFIKGGTTLEVLDVRKSS